MNDKSVPLMVADLKQYLYCPRKVYFTYVMPIEKKPTFKMNYGKIMEEKIDRLEVRRTFKRYRLLQGKRYFHVAVKSESLSLSGQIDLLITVHDHIYPVEFKFVRGFPYKSHLYQLAGYALILEDIYGAEVNRGFFYFIPDEKIFAIKISKELKASCLKVLEEIRDMILTQRMPYPVNRNRCLECECQNFCRDIW